MTVKSGQALAPTFVTSDPATGAAMDATGTPVGTLYVDGTATADAVTVTKPAGTGIYKAAVTLPVLTAGQLVAIHVTATVNAVAGAGIVFQDTADTLRISDGLTLAATGLDAITATDPGTVATTFPGMVVQIWRRWFRKTTMTATQLKTYANDGSTVDTTQTISDDGTTQTQGAAT